MLQFSTRTVLQGLGYSLTDRWRFRWMANGDRFFM